MTTAFRALIDSFDALSERERLKAAVELFRRVALPDELSDEVFRDLDAREDCGCRTLASVRSGWSISG